MPDRTKNIPNRNRINPTNLKKSKIKKSKTKTKGLGALNLSNIDEIEGRISSAERESDLDLILDEILARQYALLNGNCFSPEEYFTLKNHKELIKKLREEEASLSTRASKKLKPIIQSKTTQSSVVNLVDRGLDSLTKAELDILSKKIREIEKREFESTQHYLAQFKKSNSQNPQLADDLSLQNKRLNDLKNQVEIGRLKFTSQKNKASGLYLLSTVFDVPYAVANFLTNIPVVNFIAEPIRITSNFFKLSFLLLARDNDPKATESEKESVRNYFAKIKGYRMAEVTVNIVSTALFAGAIVLPPLIPLAIALTTLSNLMASTAAQKELNNEKKFGADDAGKPHRIKGYEARLKSHNGATLGSFSLTLATLGVVLLAAFPPAGLAALGLAVAAGILTGVATLCGCFSAYYSVKEKGHFTKAEKAVITAAENELTKGTGLTQLEQSLDKRQNRGFVARLRDLFESPHAKSNAKPHSPHNTFHPGFEKHEQKEHEAHHASPIKHPTPKHSAHSPVQINEAEASPKKTPSKPQKS